MLCGRGGQIKTDMKIVVNKCWGGFGLSPVAINEYLKLKGKECFFYKKDYDTKMLNRVPIEEASNYDTSLTKDYGKSIKEDWKSFEADYFYYNDIERDDPDLIKVVEMLGCDKASGELSRLDIVEIPDDVKWEIDNYDGMESVHEVHRVW